MIQKVPRPNTLVAQSLQIHCSTCGESQRMAAGLQAQPAFCFGEWRWFVKGSAEGRYICDACGILIPTDARCQAMTLYTDDSGYHPWEHEFLSDLEPGTSGRSSSIQIGAQGRVAYTVLVVKDPVYGVGAKVPEVEDCEVWGNDKKTVIDQARRFVRAYHAELIEQGVPFQEPRFRLHIRRVGAAEFGPRYFDEPEQENYFYQED